MANNAGTVDGSPTRQTLHVQYVDVRGKPRTDSYDMTGLTIVDAELNALTAALGAATHANLWNIGYTKWFDTGVGLAADAASGADDSVMDNIVILLKNGVVGGIDFFVPAPIEAMLVDGTENPNPDGTEFDAVLTALAAVFNGYTPYSYRYSERRKKNRARRA